MGTKNCMVAPWGGGEWGQGGGGRKVSISTWATAQPTPPATLTAHCPYRLSVPAVDIDCSITGRYVGPGPCVVWECTLTLPQSLKLCSAVRLRRFEVIVLVTTVIYLWTYSRSWWRSCPAHSACLSAVSWSPPADSEWCQTSVAGLYQRW